MVTAVNTNLNNDAVNGRETPACGLCILDKEKVRTLKILILMRSFNEILICDEMFLKIKLFGYCFYTVFILIFKEPGRWKILNVPLPSQEWVKMEKWMTYKSKRLP